MSSIKLTADSGGGSVSLKAPATTTSNAAIEIGVPDVTTGSTVITEYNNKLSKETLILEKATGDASFTVHAAQNDSGADSTIVLETSNDFAESGVIFKDSTGEAGSIRYNHGDNDIRILADGAEQCRFTSDGLKFTNGKGIDFSATGDGPTMSSELFNDYEEGTYEPEISSATSSYTSIGMHSGDTGGVYTKIGRYVYVQGCVRWTSLTIGTASGNLRVSLPFAAASRSNGDNSDDVGSIRVSSWNGSNTPTMIQPYHSQSYCWFPTGTMGNDHTAAGNGDTGDTGTIQFSISYRTS